MTGRGSTSPGTARARRCCDPRNDENLILSQFQLALLVLAQTVGEEVVEDVLAKGLKHFKWRNEPYMPVEFSVGAYRFGHSQVRPSYRANFGTSASDPTKQFFGLIFDSSSPGFDDPADLRGGRRAPRRFIDWQTFFDFGEKRVRRNKKIDTKLSTVLFSLMGQRPGEPTSPMKVPSGQRVAQAMRLPLFREAISTT